MSGSNALASARRRRAGNVETVKPAQRISFAAPRGASIPPQPTIVRGVAPNSRQPVPFPNNQNIKISAPQRTAVPLQRSIPPPHPNVKLNNIAVQNKLPVKEDDNVQKEEISETTKFFMIPKLSDKTINPFDLLKAVHYYFNRLALHIPVAVDSLGTNFNLLSQNCDNLNERLESLEKNSTSNSDNNYDDLRAEIELLKSRDLSVSNDDLRSEIENLKSRSLSNSNNDIEQLRADIEGLRSLIGETQTTVSSQVSNMLRGEFLKQLTQLRDTCSTELNQIRADYSNQITQLRNDFSSQISQLNNDFTTYTSQISAVLEQNSSQEVEQGEDDITTSHVVEPVEIADDQSVQLDNLEDDNVREMLSEIELRDTNTALRSDVVLSKRQRKAQRKKAAAGLTNVSNEAEA